MKRLCMALCALFVAGAVLAGGASADTTNNLTFNESQLPDGRYAIDVGVTYVFPGLPPRTNNTGVGTVRVSLPGSTLSLDPSQATDPAGYACIVGQSAYNETGSGVTCSIDGTPSGDGLAFPTAVTVHLIASRCWAPSPDPAQPAVADVWAAANDPGSAPDVSLPISADPCAATDPVTQPVLGGHGHQCKVPSLKGVALTSAKRRLVNAKCSVGKITFVKSATVKPRKVMSQSVKPGKLLKLNAKVNLVVSKGK